MIWWGTDTICYRYVTRRYLGVIGQRSKVLLFRLDNRVNIPSGCAYSSILFGASSGDVFCHVSCNLMGFLFNRILKQIRDVQNTFCEYGIVKKVLPLLARKNKQICMETLCLIDALLFNANKALQVSSSEQLVVSTKLSDSLMSILKILIQSIIYLTQPY